MVVFKKLFRITFLLLVLIPLTEIKGQQTKLSDVYTYEQGSRDGIGKWYMGREIAHVMGFQGMQWLDRPEREAEEETSKLLANMSIKLGDTIADIGAGSGYHVFQMAPKAKDGLIYAVDIQDEMLAELRRKKNESGIENVSLVKGGEQSVNLPKNSVDKVLIVDVYHEFSFPQEIMLTIKDALRHDGKLYLIEYRGEDDNVPIKVLHKMTEEQAVSEMKAVGLKLERNIDNLPWQHCMVFVKE